MAQPSKKRASAPATVSTVPHRGAWKTRHGARFIEHEWVPASVLGASKPALTQRCRAATADATRQLDEASDARWVMWDFADPSKPFQVRLIRGEEDEVAE